MGERMWTWGARSRSPLAGRSRGRSAISGALALLCVVVLAACGSDDGGGGAGSEPIGDGIAQPTPLAPFEASASVGEKPPDLPRRLALAMDNDREFAQAIRAGLEAATEDYDFEFVSANASGDSARNIQQLEQFQTQGVGALFVNPIDPAAQAPVMKRAIEEGAAVLSIALPPSTTQVNADQYAVGKALGDDAAEYIESELGGEASVVILNQDSVEPVQPRFEAIREAIGRVPGAKVVADVEPAQTAKDSAFETMNTILQKNPDVDVVLGADSVVLGALAALEAANKADPRQYLGGIDGEAEALAKIRAGSPYKATVSLAPQMFAYAMGKSGADWLDGKAIPQAIDITPLLLDSPEAIEDYEADTRDPGSVYLDYLTLLGNISYETRGDYLAYGWAPE